MFSEDVKFYTIGLIKAKLFVMISETVSVI
jgi:hypothetical protein